MNVLQSLYGFKAIEIFDLKNGFVINPIVYRSRHSGKIFIILNDFFLIFFQDFKYCGELKIIAQQNDCPNEYYKYTMDGTQRAIKFLKTEL
jgi:hypothetical protein